MATLQDILASFGVWELIISKEQERELDEWIASGDPEPVPEFLLEAVKERGPALPEPKCRILVEE